MLLPVLLIAVATLLAALAVYGTFPHWVIYDGGLAFIQFCRTIQWPLITVSLLCCMVLAVLVVTGRRRIWWLLGYAPVLALILQLFVTGSISNLRVVENPPLVSASEASFVQDDEYVVGVTFNDQSYAFPYRQIYDCPVVLVNDREKRMALLWSAFANRAMACNVNRQVKGRELSVVSMPANALLVYNARLGEFINGVTGLTTDGQQPTGFGSRLRTSTTNWRDWRAMHPNTRVSAMVPLSTALPVPVKPQFPMKSPGDHPDDLRVVMFEASPPVAIEERLITTDLLNVTIGQTPALVFRDANGHLRAFERRFAEREARFTLNPSTRRAAKGVAMIDLVTNSGWTPAGVAVDGDAEIIGQKLTPITHFDEGVYYGVLRNWYPDLILLDPIAK